MKEHVSLLFALLAFAFSIMAFFSKASGSVDNGVLALVGICATLIVGIHVIDDFKIRQLEKKTTEFEKMSAELERERKKQNAVISLNVGMAMWQDEPIFALKECWKAVNLSITEEYEKTAKACITITEWIVKKIEGKQELKEKVAKNKEKLPKEIRQEVKDSSIYNEYAIRIESIIDKFANWEE